MWKRIAEAGAFLHFAAALDSDTAPITRDPAGSASRPSAKTSRVTRASTRSSSRARSLLTVVSISRPITEEAGMTTSVRTGSGRVGAAVPTGGGRPLRDRATGAGSGAALAAVRFRRRGGAASAGAGAAFAARTVGWALCTHRRRHRAPAALGSRTRRRRFGGPFEFRRRPGGCGLRSLDDAFCLVHRCGAVRRAWRGNRWIYRGRPARGSFGHRGRSVTKREIRSAGAGRNRSG